MNNNNSKSKRDKNKSNQPSMFSNDYQVDDSKHGKNISKYDTTYKNNSDSNNFELLLECKDPNAPNC